MYFLTPFSSTKNRYQFQISHEKYVTVCTLGAILLMILASFMHSMDKNMDRILKIAELFHIKQDINDFVSV